MKKYKNLSSGPANVWLLRDSTDEILLSQIS